MIHKDLAHGRWFTFSLMEQLANIGTDIERTSRWKKKQEEKLSSDAFNRAIELLDLTIIDPKNKGARRKELCRVREALIDYFMYNNEYKSSDELWYNYFFHFNYAAALAKGR